MGLLDVHAQGIGEAFNRQLRNPAPPPDPPSFSVWGAMTSIGGKAQVEGALESAGTVADVLSAFGTIGAASGDSGQGMFSTGTDAEQKQAAAARERMLAGNEFDPTAGNVLRRRADEWAPNPETTHQANQVIHGLARGASKAVLDVVTMGPVAGGAVFGIDEGNVTYRKLIAKGIDPETAAKVAGVTGVASALTAGIPAVGPGVASTIGLGLATGPAAFMAQEALSREILQRAGQKDEASLHDPLDPLGLALSTLIPAAIGGLHLRSLAKITKPLKTEADVRAAAALSPAEQAASDAYERSTGNLKELQDAIAAEQRPEARAILQTELDKQVALAQQLGQETAAVRGAADPATVDAARVRVTDDALMRSMPDHPEARSEVLAASDEVAAGRVPEVQEPTVTLYHGSPHVFDAFDSEKIGTGEGAQAFGHGLYFSETPDVARNYASGAPTPTGVPRGKFAVDKVGDQYVLRDSEGVIDPADYFPTAAAAKKAAGADIFEPSGNVYKVQARAGALDKMLDWDKPLSEQPEALAAIKRAGYNPPPEATGGEFVQAYRSEGSAPYLADDLSKHGIPGIKYLDGSSRGIGEGSRNYVVFPGNEHLLTVGERNGVQIGRDAVSEVPRPDSPTLAEPGLPKPATGKPEAPSLDTRRVAQLAEESPGLRVKLPGSDETLTVGEALARAKEEAAHEASEADLVQAAVTCLLSFGA